MESVNLKMNCYQWRHTKNGYVKIRRETFVLHDVKFAQTPSTPGGCYSLDSHVKSVMHKNNTETVWCQSTAYVDTLEWFLTKLPCRKAFSLKLVNRLEFMFTFTMSPENGKCKFKDELLTNGGIQRMGMSRSEGRHLFCTMSNLRKLHQHQEVATAWTVMLKVWCTRITPKLSDVRAPQTWTR